MATLTPAQVQLLEQAKKFFIGHQSAVGVLLPTAHPPMFIKSGIEGGPWGGTHRGGIPRGRGWGFTEGGSSQGNIATHVEGHAVAIMWQRLFRGAVLIVDRPMCQICGRDLPSTLPAGSELRVISEREGPQSCEALMPIDQLPPSLRQPRQGHRGRLVLYLGREHLWAPSRVLGEASRSAA